MKKIFPAVLLLLLVSCGGKREYANPTVEIKTTYGKILVELYPQKAPQTVAAFLRYVDSGYYKKSTFYRVLKEEDQPSNAFKSELIQGGIYQSNPQLLVALPGIPLETTKETGLRHLNGTISLARTLPNSGSTEFFICVGDQPAYDYGGLANPDGLGYAAFGRVIKGMNAVRNIHASPSDGTSFIRPVEIADIIYLNPPHRD